MSDTKKSSASRSNGSNRALLTGLAVAGFALLGAVLRSLRLGWQPLWWDEGYSAYFATEPLANMLALTSVDIHPPLYYGLLHGWINSLGAPTPTVLRSFSVVAGIVAIPLFYWMAACFFRIEQHSIASIQQVIGNSEARSPQQLAQFKRSIVWLGLFLFVVNPLHIYYSQEIRMYGLALLFTIWSSGAFWRLISRDQESARSSEFSLWRRLWGLESLGYILATTAGLYTLYYSALIPIAHLIYTFWLVQIRRVRPAGALFKLFSAQVIIGLLYLPWVIYTAQRLFLYISDKIGADNDTPLGLASYIGRHILAFTTGHAWLPIQVVERFSGPLGWVTLALLGIAASGWLRRGRKTAPSDAAEGLDPVPALWFFLLVPTTLGFLLNLRLPFFPEGGERLLLIVLPYFLLLIAAGVAALSHKWLRYGLFSVLLAISAAAILFFYTDQKSVV